MPYQNKTLQLIDQLPNSKHSFFSQICSSKGDNLRFVLANILSSVPNTIAQHWKEKLHSFDNALVFQAIGEMLSFSSLQEQGWVAQDYNQKSHTIDLHHQTGQIAKLLCLSFLCERNSELEDELRTIVENGLNSCNTEQKIALIYRRPPQSRKSIERALSHFQKWLENRTSFKKHETTFYRDDYNWIECKILPSSAFLSNKTIQITQKALSSSFVLDQIDEKANIALEQVRMQQIQDTPVILSIVANQKFQITPNSWRFFFYGPTSQVSGKTYRHDADQMRGWMHDPFRTFLTGVIRIECCFHEGSADKTKIASFENPWCEFSGFSSKLPPPSLCLLSKDDFDPILQYKAS